MNALKNAPWKDWVERVIIHVPHYLSPEGEPTSGGRQRKVKDIADLVKTEWGRDCLIAQKASSDWTREDRYGNQVRGIECRLNVYGDPSFGLATRQILKANDALVYLGGEDAWPFFVDGAKGYHVGVWWDGPFPAYKKWITSKRTEAFFQACRSVLCVDTNVINWLRARGKALQDAANSAVYRPNCVDLERLPKIEKSAPGDPITILFARRFERKRGPYLALDAVSELVDQGHSTSLIMATAEGQAGLDEVRRAARKRGISDIVTAREEDMDSVYSVYEGADLAIVPTLWSEGTSYSCVEAICAGLPVVTTTVGGLPNLVIPGFNGEVVPPRPKPIADAISTISQPDRWYQYHRNCLAMRETFSKSRWDQDVLAWLRS